MNSKLGPIIADPLFVLISDVHYNINTMYLADKAMEQAINKANELNIPLMITGDLHDTKANLRGECINIILNRFKTAYHKPSIIIGNHDLLNEKSKQHSLTFLSNSAFITDLSQIHVTADTVCIPYHSNPEEFKNLLLGIPKESIILAHQGIIGSNFGEYFVDHSAVHIEDVAGRRIISGHYHNRQDIKLPEGGLWSYVGNPYTLSYAEANDPPKGFQILYKDGSLEFIPTNLRKHIIIEAEVDDSCAYYPAKKINPDDLVWIKIKGSLENISNINRKNVRKLLEGLSLPEYFKLDLISTSIKYEKIKNIDKLTQENILDTIIDTKAGVSEDRKIRLKKIWKTL